MSAPGFYCKGEKGNLICLKVTIYTHKTLNRSIPPPSLPTYLYLWIWFESFKNVHEFYLKIRFLVLINSDDYDTISSADQQICWDFDNISIWQI